MRQQMRKMWWVALWCSACAAPAGEVQPAAVGPAPREWVEEQLAAPRGTPADVGPTPERPDGVYRDREDVPVFLYPEARWRAIGEGGAKGRSRLVGSTAHFFEGLDHMPAEVPVRSLVWPGAAYPVAVSGQSFEVATLWLPARRLGGEVRCDDDRAVRVRLVGRYEVDDASNLGIRTWLDVEPGSGACEGSVAVQERLDGFASDLWIYGRGVARLGVPVPVERR